MPSISSPLYLVSSSRDITPDDYCGRAADKAAAGTAQKAAEVRQLQGEVRELNAQLGQQSAAALKLHSELAAAQSQARLCPLSGNVIFCDSRELRSPVFKS